MGLNVNFHVKDKKYPDLDWEERSKDMPELESDNKK